MATDEAERNALEPSSHLAESSAKASAGSGLLGRVHEEEGLLS